MAIDIGALRAFLQVIPGLQNIAKNNTFEVLA
jgi:hypothetical protein